MDHIAGALAGALAFPAAAGFHRFPQARLRDGLKMLHPDCLPVGSFGPDR